jgi:ABC-type multidrug transport system fused ATPase/permease subunit
VRIRLILLRRLTDAGWPLVAALTATLVVQALLPAAMAVASAAVVSAMQQHEARGESQVGAALAVLGLVLLVNVVLRALLRPLLFLTRNRIDGAHRIRVAELALCAETVDVLEQPEVQDLIKVAVREPSVWLEKNLSDGAVGQLRTLVHYAGLLATATVLASFAWWLVLTLGASVLAVRALATRRWVRHYRIWSAGMPDHRYGAYWAEVATTPVEGKELRVFGLGDWLVDRHLHHIHGQLGPVWRDDVRSAYQMWLHAILMFAPLAAAYFLVAHGTARGAATIAVAVAALTAAWSVYATLLNLDDLANVAGAVSIVKACSELTSRLAGPPAPTRPGHRPASSRPPLIAFEDVVFTYPGAHEPLLDGLTLTIQPGEWLAIVGHNGAGKSTLVKLLAGLYRPVAGRITADGVDIHAPENGGITAWRSRLTVVFQDFVRYQLSAADNVTLGWAGPADVPARDAAAAEAGFDAVVTRLPAGWATPLARTRSGGVDLSGGQWQQVGLARALYAVRTGADVLVLDEPTAHLDVRTELDVFSRLADVRQDATTILISHRLSTVRRADRIVLLDGGRLAESGTHAELMAHGGQYARMFRIQAERFARGFEDRLDDVAPYGFRS